MQVETWNVIHFLINVKVATVSPFVSFYFSLPAFTVVFMALHLLHVKCYPWFNSQINVTSAFLSAKMPKWKNGNLITRKWRSWVISVALELHSELSAKVLESPLKVIWRHAITILILQGRRWLPRFGSPKTCNYSNEQLTVEQINETACRRTFSRRLVKR